MGDLSPGLHKLENILDGSEPDQLDFLVLQRITKNFSDERKIGRGGCATVYKGILPSGRIIAVKKLLSAQTADDRMFMQEVTAMIRVKHPNVVRSIGYCSQIKQQAMQIRREQILAEERERLLCFEYMSNGSLEDHVTDELKGLEWHTRFQIIKGICEGLHHLHHKEINIIHMDLKPANILLNDDLVPKISDFGISRSGDTSETISESRMYSPHYCAPEYREKGHRTSKSDIYSLGVIINEVVTGCREERPIATVHRRWRHRWKNLKQSALIYHQQVAKCLELAQKCKCFNPAERPSILDIIHELNEINITCIDVSHYSKPNMEQQKSSFLVDMLAIEPLNLHLFAKLNKQISHSIQVTNDTDDHVAFRISPEEKDMAFVISPTRQIRFYMHPSIDVVSPRSSCIVTITLEALKKPLPEYCVTKLYVKVKSIKVDKGLTAKHITTDMFKEEPDKVVDVVDLMVTLSAQNRLLVVQPQELCYWPIEPNKPLPCSLQLTNRTDDYVAYAFIMPKGKMLYYRQTRTGIMPPCSTRRVIMDMVVEEEALAKMQCKDTCLMQSVIVNKDLRICDVSVEFFNAQTGVHEMLLDILFSEKAQSPSPVHLYRTMGGEQNSKDDEPELMGDVATLISPLTMKTVLLHIYPSELCFTSEEGKEYISLINKTEDEVICAIQNDKNRVVLPRSTHAILVSYNETPHQFGVIMVSGSRHYRIPDDLRSMYHHMDKDKRRELMNQVRAEGGKAQEALLPCVVGGPRQENKQHETVIIRMDENHQRIESIDVHPKEPWIVACLSGLIRHTVCIWKVDPKTGAFQTIKSKSKNFLSFYPVSVKFIARMQWVACGDMDGNISVFTYALYTYADNRMTEIKRFEAEEDTVHLAVHPTLPYLLSSSSKGSSIKLWDWDQGWRCTRKFSCSSVDKYIRTCEMAFNPMDATTFASLHNEGEINIWRIDSEDPLTTIRRGSSTVHIAYCNTGGDLQCLAATTWREGKIELLDLRSNTATHVHTLQAEDLLQKKSEIASHPTRPLLVAAGSAEHVFLWNYTTSGLKKVDVPYHSSTIGVGFIDVEGFQRLVIADDRSIMVVDIGI